jgi:hypothetical protein
VTTIGHSAMTKTTIRASRTTAPFRRFALGERIQMHRRLAAARSPARLHESRRTASATPIARPGSGSIHDWGRSKPIRPIHLMRTQPEKGNRLQVLAQGANRRREPRPAPRAIIWLPPKSQKRQSRPWPVILRSTISEMLSHVRTGSFTAPYIRP